MNETNRPRPNVGQTLYRLNIGRAARYSNQELVPVVVTSVARKYFKAKGGVQWEAENTYRMDTWRDKTEYGASYQLYQSPEKWEEEKESVRLHAVLREVFCGTGYSLGIPLSDLRKIAEICRVKLT